MVLVRFVTMDTDGLQEGCRRSVQRESFARGEGRDRRWGSHAGCRERPSMGSEGGRNPREEGSRSRGETGQVRGSRTGTAAAAPSARSRLCNRLSRGARRRRRAGGRGRRPMPAAPLCRRCARRRLERRIDPPGGLRAAPPRKSRRTIGSACCRRGNVGLGRGHHVDVSAWRTGPLYQAPCRVAPRPSRCAQVACFQILEVAPHEAGSRFTGLERP
jgi:hypothetical protein